MTVHPSPQDGVRGGKKKGAAFHRRIGSRRFAFREETDHATWMKAMDDEEIKNGFWLVIASIERTSTLVVVRETTQERRSPTG
jgi:hypothetical protein